MASPTLLAILIGCVVINNIKSQTIINKVYKSELIDDGRTVLLGGLFPIHEHNNGTINCGKFHGPAIQMVESMVHAIDTINKDMELLPKIKLKFSIRDTCSTPSHALEQAFHFVQRSNSDSSCTKNETDAAAVSGVLGGYFSRVSIDLANLLRLYKIPQISYISTADVLGDKTRFDYFFRTVPPDSLQSRAIADIIVYFNWTYIFALHTDDTYGNGGINALIQHLNKHNESIICIAVKIPLAVTATQEDYDNAIDRMSQNYVSNATVAVLFSHIEAANGLMQALQRQYDKENYDLKNVTWIGTDSWGDSLSDDYRSIPGGLLSILQRADRYRIFDDYFLSLNPENYTRNTWFNEFWETNFNCSLINASCKTLNNLNTSAYRQINDLTLISDAVYSFAHAIQNLVQKYCSNNMLCEDILEDRTLGKAINGELLRDQLYNISFLGHSSNLVYFDRNGENKGAYIIKNLKRSTVKENAYAFETVGLWDHELLLNFTSSIEWPAGPDHPPRSTCSDPCQAGHEPNTAAQIKCCWYCSPCQSDRGYSNGLTSCQDCPKEMTPNKEKSACIPITIRNLMFSNAWSITLLTLAVIGLIAIASTSIVFIAYSKHGVIKASSREVSTILLVGLALCYIMPFFFVAKPSPAVCAMRRFGVGFSFAMCFSALLVKTNRIHRIFNQKSLNPSKPPQFTSSLSQVIMTLALTGIQGLAAIIWIAADPPSTTITYGLHYADLKCDSSPILYVAVSLGYSFILLVLSTYNAFLARKVPENFNEAKYINAALYALCIIWLAFISIYFGTIELGTVYQSICIMVTIVLSASVTLVCIFIPRVILLVSTLGKTLKQKGVTATTNETTDY